VTRVVSLLSGRRIVLPDAPVDRRIAAVAAAQYGRMSYSQLLAAGCSEKMVRGRVRSGVLAAEHRGVYRVGPPVGIAFAREASALLAIGGASALDGRSAAAVHGLLSTSPKIVQIVALAPSRPRPRAGIRICTSERLTSSDIRVRRGLRVISAELALLRLAVDADDHTLELAFDEALGRGLIDRSSIGGVIGRFEGHPGAPALRRLLDPARGTGATRSRLERRVLEIVRRAGLPDPERNHSIGAWTIDLYWEFALFGVEIDSWQWHQGAAAFHRDRRKDLALRELGIDLLRVSARTIEDPVRIAARLALTLGDRGRALAARSNLPAVANLPAAANLAAAGPLPPRKAPS
jgi:very-short-patch-repair endonuclease